MNWSIFLSGLLGSSLPGLIVAVYFNRSLERLKGDLQRDIFKFSKWHERRIEAVIAIYDAFQFHLDFLRRRFYVKGENGPIDQIHDFPKLINKQIMFLDDTLAEEVLQYQTTLLAFWNDTIANGGVASPDTRYRLDYELPAILPKLRRAINKSMDPLFNRSKPTKLNSILHMMEAGGPRDTNT